jgi:hypothetical protein
MRFKKFIILGLAIVWCLFDVMTPKINAMHCCVCEERDGYTTEHVRYGPVPCNCFDPKWEEYQIPNALNSYCQSKCWEISADEEQVSSKNECKQYAELLVEQKCPNFLFVPSPSPLGAASPEWECITSKADS